MSGSDPFIRASLSDDWRDMAQSIYAVMAKKPIEYLFMLNDGRYVVCAAPELCLYQKGDGAADAALFEQQSPIGWRLREGW